MRSVLRFLPIPPILLALVLVAQTGGDKTAEAAYGVADSLPGSVDSIAIDMDPFGAPANPDNGLLGSIDTCRAVPLGSSFDVDVVIDEIDPADLLQAHNPSLQYAGSGPGAVHITGIDTDRMLASNPGSDVLPLNDATPDSDGYYTIGAGDIGPAPDAYESGEGVLARVTLTAVGPEGVSDIRVVNPFVVDAIGSPVPVNNIGRASVVVGDFNGDTVVDDLDCDLSDFDGDGVPDVIDNCFKLPNFGQPNADGDAYGDVCDNCPSVPTPWFVPVGDTDCDGFADDAELFVGTDANDPCGVDAWPADFDNDLTVTILDVTQLTPPVYNSFEGDPLYTPRKDLDPNGRIHILDIVKLFPPMFNSSCTP